MIKILKSKKGINDVVMIWTIIVILFSLGIFVPFIDDYFSGVSTDYNPDDVAQEVGVGLPQTDTDETNVNALEVMASIIAMFFWGFNIHWIINLVLLEPMRIILYILIYRLIRSGGG